MYTNAVVSSSTQMRMHGQVTEPPAPPEDPFEDSKRYIWQALQEVNRMIEVIKMSAPSAENLAVQQIIQPGLTATQKTHERLESTVRAREDLNHAADILESGVANLRLQMKYGERYRGELRQIRREFLVRQAVRGGVLVDCSHRSAGSRMPVQCDVAVAMENDGRVSVANQPGLEHCTQYLRTQLRNNFQAELFQMLSQEGLVYSGSGTHYFVLHASEKQIKLECNHVGIVTMQHETGNTEELDQVCVILEDSGERCDVVEVALQALLRTRHTAQRRAKVLMDDVVDMLVHHVCRTQVASELEEYCKEMPSTHAHWYTTSSFTTSAFDIVSPERCLHCTLVGSDIHIVDTLSPGATCQVAAVNEFRSSLRFRQPAA